MRQCIRILDTQTGLLANQKAIRNGSNLLDLSYEYNRGGSVGSLNGKTGHLTKTIDHLNNNKNREYEYDAVGRLTKMKGGATGNLSSQSYSYDRYGNRINVTAAGVAADGSPIPRDGIPNLTYNNTSNRITTAGFEYDVAGNQTRALAEDGVTWVKYEYDAANRLQLVKRDDTNQTQLQAFQYGSTNARLMDTDYLSSFTRMFASVGGTVLAEYHENFQTPLTWIKSYVFLGERLLSTTTPNGAGGESTEFDHPDKLGTRLITNPQAGSSYEQMHLPFGIALNAESTGSINRRFTSYDRSARTGLDYAINRTYDSKLGRFTQVDPIGIKATKLEMPQTLNLYTYCANDPINHIDPDGLSFWSIFKKIFKFIINIAKIVAFVVVIVLPAIATFGIFLGIAISIAAYIAIHILVIAAQTIWRNIKQTIKAEGFSLGSFFKGLWRGIKQAFSIVKEIFSKGFATILSVYGYFCAPNYGADGSTRNLTPIDGLDAACKEHDLRMLELDRLLEQGKITKKEWKKQKNKADWKFLKKAFTSSNSATGAYFIGAFFTFTFRIIFR